MADKSTANKKYTKAELSDKGIGFFRRGLLNGEPQSCDKIHCIACDWWLEQDCLKTSIKWWKDNVADGDWWNDEALI